VFEFVKALGFAFTQLYGPFLHENKALPYTDNQREYQLLRRSRYVEFNLLFDRGTKFGIESEVCIAYSVPVHLSPNITLGENRVYLDVLTRSRQVEVQLAP